MAYDVPGCQGRPKDRLNTCLNINCGFKKKPTKTTKNPQQLVLQGAFHKYTCTLVLNAFSYVDCRAFAVSSVSLDPHPPF